MAEDSDLERTEPASARKLQQAREKGQVARSRELATFAVLMTAGAAIALTGGALLENLSGVMRANFILDRAAAFDSTLMFSRFIDAAWQTLFAFSPFVVVVILAALLSHMVLSGWMFSAQALNFELDRLNPISGFSRIFSWQGAAELFKAIVKSVLIGGVAAWVILGQREEWLALLHEPLSIGLAHMAKLVSFTFLAVAGSLVLVAMVDVPFQLWNFHRGMRMTKEEVRQELKETEGDPQIKARIRSLQREAARRRMMAEVPKADVVVTNPRHYAVALAYQESKMAAPKVVAKGAQLVAERIKELAREHRVPVLEAPPLARALFRHADLGQEIPAQLYTAVAQVLAYVYQLRVFEQRGGEQQPQPPSDLPVPAHLDPGVAERAAT
jgi:flagellar biosynthetic protein FlhB